MATYCSYRRLILFLLLAGVALSGSWSCDTQNALPDGEPGPDSLINGVVHRDLNTILKRGKIVVLTENTSTSYFIYKGRPLGFEYELMEEFAEYLGVDLEIKLIEDINAVFEDLNHGHCDLVAANLTVTRQRSEIVRFSEPYLITRQVLVQAYPDGWEFMPKAEQKAWILTDPIELIDKEIHVRTGSSFKERLNALSDEIGGEIHIIPVPGHTETEELIRQVAAGEIRYTIADENVALLNKHYYPNINVDMAISFPQQIAFAGRQSSPELVNALNRWLKTVQKDGHRNYLFKKYHEHITTRKEHFTSDYSTLAGGSISPYDSLLREWSDQIPWDWRLVAALIYQESKFEHHKQSWAGAFGIMQLMPGTAARYGLTPEDSPEEHIAAGIDKLRRLDEFWKPKIADADERVKFVLASYNAGHGHVMDACRLADKYGKDPSVWEGHVAEFILRKSRVSFYSDEVVKYGYCRGSEPYKYVQEILTRYEAYQKLISI